MGWPSPDASTGLEAPLLPLEVSEDVKLERMETGDADAAPEETSEPKKPRPIRRFEVLALAQVLASFWSRPSRLASCWPRTRAPSRARRY